MTDNRFINMEDVELVRQINSGDHLAFEALFQRYKENLYRHAYRMIPDTDVCNDIIQDVFLAIWTKRGLYVINSSVSAYLAQSVKYRILDYISHQKVVERYLGEMYAFDKEGQCFTEEHVLERELLALIADGKSKLPPRTREIFEMNREQQLSYKEIGEILHISDKTAKKQVHNALKYLRTKLNPLLSFLILFF